MEFILFQVGESEEVVDKNGNPCPALSKKGAKAAIAGARGLGRIIPRKAKIQVWSSMSVPASQTAEYIAEELGVKRKCLKLLDTTDLNTLLEIAFEHGRGDTLIIIAHNSNLTEWAEKLTGLKLPFTDAAAASLSIDPAAPESADLLWFIHPRYLKNIG